MYGIWELWIQVNLPNLYYLIHISIAMLYLVYKNRQMHSARLSIGAIQSNQNQVVSESVKRTLNRFKMVVSGLEPL